MRRNIPYILIIMFLPIFGCQNIAKVTNQIIEIEKHDVNSIFIKKGRFDSDSIYFLTENEHDILLNEINNSEPKGMYKMITEFHVFVILSNDSTRIFRLTNNLLKEDNDYTFSISNPQIIKDFWKKAEEIPPPPPLPPMLRECDSLSKMAKIDYKNGVRKHTTFGLVYATDFEQFHSKYMKENFDITTRASCTIGYSEECYYGSMNREIENEYGENFIHETREKAKIEFERLKK